MEEESNSEEPVSDASLAIHDPRLEKQELDELVWVDPLELNTTKYKGEKTVTPDGQIIWSFLKLNMEIKYCLQPKPRLVCLCCATKRLNLVFCFKFYKNIICHFDSDFICLSQHV